MSWLPWRRAAEEEPVRPVTVDVLSSALRYSLATVGDAVKKCSEVGEGDRLGARREVAGALRESMAVLADLVRDPPPSQRVRRMAKGVAEEAWTLARPWLVLNFVFADRSVLSDEQVGAVRLAIGRRAAEVEPHELDQLADELEALSLLSVHQADGAEWQAVVDMAAKAARRH